LEDEADFYDDVEYLVQQRFWLAKRQNQQIVSICWMEDPLQLTDEKYRNIFHTSLTFWAIAELKNDSNLR
jgi:hypothetical protein